MRFTPWHTRCSTAGMNVSLFQAAAAMNANSRWQEVIAENLASSSVPGFKKQELSLAAVQADFSEMKIRLAAIEKLLREVE